MFDAGIAAQTLCLAACNEGLGTVIMGIFDENEVASVIGLDSSQSVSALIAIGYPDEQPVMPKRKETIDLIEYR
jgi:nitroreductase